MVKRGWMGGYAQRNDAGYGSTKRPLQGSTLVEGNLAASVLMHHDSSGWRAWKNAHNTSFCVVGASWVGLKGGLMQMA